MRMGIGSWLNFKNMSPQKAVTLVFVTSLLLLIVSYGIWQFGRIISPSQRFSNDPVVHLSVTDYDNRFVALPNSLTDPTLPYFEPAQTKPTILRFGADGKLDMARLEVRVDYR